MVVKYYIDESGKYLGAYNVGPSGGTEVASHPENAAATWNGSGWDEPAPQAVTQFSSITFFDRYTTAEQEAIAAATLLNVQIKIAYDKMLGADYIDVTDLATIAGVDALIAAGLVDASRKSAILATA